jgi:tryptophanyl-tRNA synthetase
MIDPWGSAQYQDYQRLRDEFGIELFTEELLEDLPDVHHLLARQVIFGHRGFQRIRDAIRSGDPWAVMTGLMPSGKMHYGHKMVIEQVIYYQRSCGADVHIAVADFESYATRGISLKKARELAIENYIKPYIAMGLSPEKGEVYFQSKRHRVKDLAQELSLRTNLSEMQALYGFKESTSMAHLMAPLIQAADILHVQRPELGGPRPTLVPVGVDQDPHIRLTRDLANRVRLYSVKRTEDGRHGVFLKPQDLEKSEVKSLLDAAESVLKRLGFAELSRNDAYHAIYIKGASNSDLADIDNELARTEPRRGGHGFITPSSSYHRFQSGLDGGKMSSSRPPSAIFLDDTLKDAEKKIDRAKTGGRPTVEEQRRLGADADKCTIYEMFHYHQMLDEKELVDTYRRCKGGDLLCGECKLRSKELLREQHKDLQERVAQVTDQQVKQIMAED